MKSSDGQQCCPPDTEWKRLFGNWRIYLEKPVPVEDLTEHLESASIPSGGFYFMLGLSAGIAILGLISDSAAVIIGAMIIAPLMNPITSLSYASVRGKDELMMRSLLTLITGILLVLAVSYATTLLVGSRVVGSEILSRTNPNLMDLGVASGAGAAGAFALTRSKIGSAIPGVAVAVALVPPLCVAGIGLAFGTKADHRPGNRLLQSEASISGGAFLLFLTNLRSDPSLRRNGVRVAGIRLLENGAPPDTIVTIALAVLAVPLSYSFRAFYYRGKILATLRAVAVDKPEWEEIRLLELEVDLLADPVVARLDVRAAKGAFDHEDLLFVEQGVKERLHQPIRFEIYLTEFTKLATSRSAQLPLQSLPNVEADTGESE